MDKRLKRERSALRDVWLRNNIRTDWHEPDEQGIGAIVTGVRLDNSMGVSQSDIPAHNQEIVVHLACDGVVEHSINLADLLAIATDM
jgi:hypothetical protein